MRSALEATPHPDLGSVCLGSGVSDLVSQQGSGKTNTHRHRASQQAGCTCQRRTTSQAIWGLRVEDWTQYTLHGVRPLTRPVPKFPAELLEKAMPLSLPEFSLLARAAGPSHLYCNSFLKILREPGYLNYMSRHVYLRTAVSPVY